MFVVNMLRFGNIEMHSYILGCYTTFEQARFAGEVEKSWRGGKYEYEITLFNVNDPVDQDKWIYHMECTDG